MIMRVVLAGIAWAVLSAAAAEEQTNWWDGLKAEALEKCEQILGGPAAEWKYQHFLTAGL